MFPIQYIKKKKKTDKIFLCDSVLCKEIIASTFFSFIAFVNSLAPISSAVKNLQKNN